MKMLRILRASGGIFLVLRLGLRILPELDFEEAQFVKGPDAAIGIGETCVKGIQFGGPELSVRHEHDFGQQDVVHQGVGLTLAHFDQEKVEFLGIAGAVRIEQHKPRQAAEHPRIVGAVLLADEDEELIQFHHEFAEFERRHHRTGRGGKGREE